MSIRYGILKAGEFTRDENAMSMPPLVTFILERMDQQNLSQIELSRRARVPNSTLDRLLSGTVQEPKPSVLFKIAKPLGVSYKRLMVLSGYPIDEPDTEENQDRRLLELAGAFPWLTATIEDMAHLSPEDREAILAYIETIHRRNQRSPR